MISQSKEYDKSEEISKKVRYVKRQMCFVSGQSEISPCREMVRQVTVFREMCQTPQAAGRCVAFYTSENK